MQDLGGGGRGGGGGGGGGGGVRTGGGGGCRRLFSGFDPLPTQRKGPPLCCFEISIFGDGAFGANEN